MSNQSKVNGFTVLVHDGREITAGEFEKLDSFAQAKVQSKVNGPHHSAKWAVDRKNRRCVQHGFSLPFNASKKTLAELFFRK